MFLKSAVLLFSGGLDSTSLYYDLALEGFHVVAVNFNYGQRHFEQEHNAAKSIHDRVQETFVNQHFEFQTVKLQYEVPLSNNALTNHSKNVPSGEYTLSSLSGTVVPGRNMTFLSIAYGIAYTKRASIVATAVHGGDHAIYPDCRPKFVYAMQEVYDANIDDSNFDISLYTPYIDSSKTEIAYRALKNNVPIHLSYSCYKGSTTQCGKCATCLERAEAIALASYRIDQEEL